MLVVGLTGRDRADRGDPVPPLERLDLRVGMVRVRVRVRVRVSLTLTDPVPPLERLDLRVGIQVGLGSWKAGFQEAGLGSS